MEPCSIVIFGATGDLAHNKLIPALFELHKKDALHERTEIFCLGRRRDYDAKKLCEEYRKHVKGSGWNDFCKRIQYHLLEFDDMHEYETLNEKLEKYHNRLFYLATPQNAFGTIVEHMGESNLARRHPERGWHRVVFEKPFGSDLKSATELNEKITRLFKEDQIYRIDHYVAKSFVQEILVLRFANPVFRSVWDNSHITRVQITSAEDKGVGSRAEYYDSAGVMRDMIQNHLLQLLSLIAMDMPKSLDAADIRDAKTAVLDAIRDVDSGNLVLGQYQGYEKDIGKESSTETYAAVKLEVDNKRWKGVPFYLASGKKLDGKYAEIMVEFSTKDCPLFQNPMKMCGENKLVIRIQPLEGVEFHFNLAENARDAVVEPHVMEYVHETIGHNTPEAYEYLLAEAIRGDQTLFTRWDFVRRAWEITDNLRKNKKEVLAYEPGTPGPMAALRMLSYSHRHWSKH